jgi:glycosyltransferase involved in cell wall biosynthesis
VKPTKLLIYEPYPFASEGGNAKTLRYILEGLDRERCEPIVVAPLRTEFLDRLNSAGTRAVALDPPSRVNQYGRRALEDGLIGRIRTSLSLMRHNLDVARLIRSEGVDVIYANCIRAVLCTAMAAKLTGVPVLWYVKGELENPLLDRLGLLLAARTLFFCEANKRDRYHRLISMLDGRVGVLPIGLDLAEIDAVRGADHTGLRQELDIRRGNVNIVVLAQLYRPKGLHLLIEALGALDPLPENLRLYVVGDHVIEEHRAYRDEVLARVRELGLEDKVRFTGWRRDALAILANMDVLVHPSLAEGFGRAVLEAMAMGLPVCVSRVGGLRELVEDGVNGFSFDAGDVSGLREKLARLLASAELRSRLGAAARERVFTSYHIEDKVRLFQEEVLTLAAAR